MAKGRIVKKKVLSERKKDHFYFLDGAGNLRSVKRNTKGGKKGRTVCRKKPAKKTKSRRRK